MGSKFDFAEIYSSATGQSSKWSRILEYKLQKTLDLSQQKTEP